MPDDQTLPIDAHPNGLIAVRAQVKRERDALLSRSRDEVMTAPFKLDDAGWGELVVSIGVPDDQVRAEVTIVRDRISFLAGMLYALDQAVLNIDKAPRG